MKVKWKRSEECLWIFLQISASYALMCVQEDNCSCSLSDGSGKVDLNILNKTISTGSSLPIFSLSPCHLFSIANSSGNCSDVYLCFQDKKAHYVGLGLKKPTFQVKERNAVRSILMEYVTSKGSRDTVTFVNLECSHDAYEAKLTGGMVNSTFYNLTLHSQHCCLITSAQTELSAGSIILIVFFSIVTSYFVVGILYNKTVYAVSGLELVPHYYFWSELPGLIKDGYLFFISPCLGDSVEYKYYQRL